MICSGDLTRVGSGGDFTSGSSGTSGTGGWGLQLEIEMAVSRPSSVSSVDLAKYPKISYTFEIKTTWSVMSYGVIFIIGAVYV